MIWLQALWSRIWPYIATVAAAFAAFFAIRQSGKAAGKEEARREVEQATSEQRRQINEADSRISQMDDSDIRRELRRWVRPADSEDR